MFFIQTKKIMTKELEAYKQLIKQTAIQLIDLGIKKEDFEIVKIGRELLKNIEL